jgi:FkbM family methyltransferase
MGLTRKLATLWRAARESGHFWKRLAAEFLLQTGTTTLFSIHRPGYTLTYFPTSLSTALFLDPAARLDDELLLAAYLRPGDVVVDVGSNIGTHALAAAQQVGEQGVVVAIEPHPRIFTYLQENVRRNQLANITTLNLAIGDHDGEVAFSDRWEDDENAVLPQGQAPLRVPVRRLDTLAPAVPRPIALLKIDVEGYELAVLRGACATLPRVAAVLWEACEEHCARYGYAAGEVYSLLEEHGFTSYWFKPRERVLVPLPTPRPRVGCCNLLALRNLADFCGRTGYAVNHPPLPPEAVPSSASPTFSRRA